jgi:hypothetical protein
MPKGPQGQKRPAGVSDKLWSMENIAELIEARAATPGKRGSYKKRAA